MSDFYTEIKSKLREINQDKGKLEQQLKEGHERIKDLNRAADGLETLLRLEGVSNETSSFTSPDHWKGSPEGEEPRLAEILKESLADSRPRAVDELVQIAQRRGVDFKDKDPFKSVNFTLMGISRGGKIHRTDDGLWYRNNP